ncbi:MAG: dienelactone hydrolase family protein [Candidatus Krumholzibacteriia bacterium]
MRYALAAALACLALFAGTTADASSKSRDPEPLAKDVTMVGSLPQGYLATPAGGAGPGVIVLHAWWGLNDTIKGFCRQLAEAGYVAYAPDMFHGKVARTIPEAQALSGAAEGEWQAIRARVLEAAKAFAVHEGVAAGGMGVMGFSFGASYALFLSDDFPARIRATVVYYGSWADGFEHSQSAYLGHFAEQDPYEDPAGAKALEDTIEKAGLAVTIHSYPGTKHWFVEPDRTAEYDPDAAALAWQRTLDFLGETLR